MSDENMNTTESSKNSVIPTESAKKYDYKGIIISKLEGGGTEQRNLVLLFKSENEFDLAKAKVYGVLSKAFESTEISESGIEIINLEAKEENKGKKENSLNLGNTISWNESDCDHAKRTIHSFHRQLPIFEVKIEAGRFMIKVGGVINEARLDVFHTKIKPFHIEADELNEPGVYRYAWIRVESNMKNSREPVHVALEFDHFEAVGRKKQRMMYAVMKDEVMQCIEKKKFRGKEQKERRPTHCPPPDRIPLPPLNEHLREDRLSWLREVSKMHIITARSPVSICMYTTMNAPVGVSSCHFSDDSSLLVLGLSDSSIVLNALDAKKRLRKLRDMDCLEMIDIETASNVQSRVFESSSQKSARLNGHGGSVVSVNVSPDRRLLLSASTDRTVRLWSVETQRNVLIHRTPSVVWQAQFCQRGFYFATASVDRTACVWSTDRMHPLRMFVDAQGDVTCIDYHPNCNYVAGGSDDRYVHIWDVLTGHRVRWLGEHNAPVVAVKFSPCGRYLVALDLVGNLVVWELGEQRIVGADSTGISATKGHISFSRDGGVFAVSYGSDSVHVFSLDTLLATPIVDYNPSIRIDGFNIGRYPTKKAPVVGLHFTRRNVLLAFGCHGQH